MILKLQNLYQLYSVQYIISTFYLECIVKNIIKFYYLY